MYVVFFGGWFPKNFEFEPVLTFDNACIQEMRFLIFFRLDSKLYLSFRVPH